MKTEEIIGAKIVIAIITMAKIYDKIYNSSKYKMEWRLDTAIDKYPCKMNLMIEPHINFDRVLLMNLFIALNFFVINLRISSKNIRAMKPIMLRNRKPISFTNLII